MLKLTEQVISLFQECKEVVRDLTNLTERDQWIFE